MLQLCIDCSSWMEDQMVIYICNMFQTLEANTEREEQMNKQGQSNQLL